MTADIEAVIDEATRRCLQQGARLTDKRRQVLTGLLRSDTALSAYDLVEYFRREHDYTIAAMSVYRILDFLREQGLVHRLSLASKYVACSHITCDHEHGVPQFLICGKCQRVKEIRVSQSTIDALTRRVDEAGFHLVGPQLEVNCVCENCLQAAA